MAAETDIAILLTNYNSQLQLNTTEGNQCAATLAAEINSILQSKLNKPPSVALREDMLSLIQTQEDAEVYSKQARQVTTLWVIVSIILLVIIVYLWNFK